MAIHWRTSSRSSGAYSSLDRNRRASCGSMLAHRRIVLRAVEGAFLRSAWLDQDAPSTLRDFVLRQRAVERRVVVWEIVRRLALVVAARSAAIEADDGLHATTRSRSSSSRRSRQMLQDAPLPPLTCVRPAGSRPPAHAPWPPSTTRRANVRTRTGRELTFMGLWLDRLGEQASGAMTREAPCTRRDWRSSTGLVPPSANSFVSSYLPYFVTGAVPPLTGNPSAPAFTPIAFMRLQKYLLIGFVAMVAGVPTRVELVRRRLPVHAVTVAVALAHVGRARSRR